MKLKSIIVFLLAGHLAFAAELPYNLSSPYQTILTHTSYLEPDNYKPEIAGMAFNPKLLGNRDAGQLAVKLIQVYKGAGINIEFEHIPQARDYVDSLTGKQVYHIAKKFPQLYLEKVGEEWYYSAETMREIESLHNEVYPFGAGELLDLLPKMGNNKYLGLYLWQILGILILVFTAFIVHKVFTFILEKVIIKILIVQGHVKIAGTYVLPVARPLSILIVFPILIIFIPVLQLPYTLNSYTIIVLKALWPLFATIVCYKLVDLLGLYLTKLADKTENTLDDQLVPLARKALKVFVIIIGVLGILANLDIDILPLLTGLSIGGLAFALAAQDTIKNFFGSIMIFLDKPFQIGDWIISGDIDGTVEEVGFRATRVRTAKNSVTYVPNGMLADKTVDNMGLRNFRRFSTKLSIHYSTAPEVITSFVEELRKVVKDHPDTIKDNWQVYLNDFTDSGLSVLFTVFFEVPSLADELRCRQEVMMEVVKVADRLGVRFAYPTRTLYMEADSIKGKV
jgi:MscS family membrane protein